MPVNGSLICPAACVPLPVSAPNYTHSYSYHHLAREILRRIAIGFSSVAPSLTFKCGDSCCSPWDDAGSWYCVGFDALTKTGDVCVRACRGRRCQSGSRADALHTTGSRSTFRNEKDDQAGPKSQTRPAADSLDACVGLRKMPRAQSARSRRSSS